MASATPVLGGLVVSIYALWRLDPDMRRVSCRYEVKFSPEGKAFSIWFFIYTHTAVAGLLVLTRSVEPLDSLTMWLWAGAWACVVLWVFFFYMGDTHPMRAGLWFALSSVALLACAALSAVAVHESSAWRPLTSLVWSDVFVQAAISVFAGWTLCASALNVAIAWIAYTENTVACPALPPATRKLVVVEEETPAWAKVVSAALCALAAGVCFVVRDPFYVLGPAVFALSQRTSVASVATLASIAALALGATGAVLRAI